MQFLPLCLFLHIDTPAMGKRGKADRKTVLLNYKLWLSSITGDGVISDDTYELLILIREKGSLKASAESLGMSYRRAWGNIHDAENLLGYELTNKERGGKDGGQSTLTNNAVKLLEAYQILKTQFGDAAQKAYNSFQNKINKKDED